MPACRAISTRVIPDCIIKRPLCISTSIGRYFAQSKGPRRATLIGSATGRVDGGSSFAISTSVVFIRNVERGQETPSVSHRVYQNIDPHWVRPLFGELLEIAGIDSFALPPVAGVGVVANERHHPSLVVV